MCKGAQASPTYLILVTLQAILHLAEPFEQVLLIPELAVHAAHEPVGPYAKFASGLREVIYLVGPEGLLPGHITLEDVDNLVQEIPGATEPLLDFFALALDPVPLGVVRYVVG